MRVMVVKGVVERDHQKIIQCIPLVTQPNNRKPSIISHCRVGNIDLFVPLHQPASASTPWRGRKCERQGVAGSEKCIVQVRRAQTSNFVYVSITICFK